MPGNLLAEEMVRITTEGMERAEQMTDALGVSFDRMSAAARKAESFVKSLASKMTTALSAPQRMLNSVKEKIEGLGKSLKSITAGAGMFTLGGALGVGGIIRGAASGTYEADRLGKAFEYLNRVLGDQFAPYIRMLTQGLIEMANAFRSLSPETKATIASWAIWTTAIAATVTILPFVISGVATLVGGLATLAGAMAACIGPTGAAIAALVALGMAGVNAFSTLDDAEGQWLKNHGLYMELAAKMSDNFFKTFGAGFAEYIRKSGVGLGLMAIAAGEKIGIFAPGTLKGAQMDEAAELRKRTEEAKKFQQALEGIKKVKDQAFGKAGGGLFGGIEAMIERIKKAGAGGGFGMKLDVRFESSGQTWDRLQIAFAEQSKGVQNVGEAQLIEAKKANDNLQAVKVGVEKIAAKPAMIQ